MRFQAIKAIIIGYFNLDVNFGDKNKNIKGNPKKNLDTFIDSKSGYSLRNKENIDNEISIKMKELILLFRKLLNFLFPKKIIIK